MSDIDKFIENIKSTVTALADLIKEIDAQREREKNEFEKRISRLEYDVYNK